MVKFIFTKNSKKNFLKLDKNEQEKIREKLKYFKNIKNLSNNIKRVNSMQPITHRLRVGKYRLLLHLALQKNKNYTFKILKLGHRKKIYK